MSLKFCNFAVSHLVSRISPLNWQATSMSKVNFKKTKQGGGFFVRGNHFPSVSLHSGHLCMTTKYCPNFTDQCKKVSNDCKLIYSSTNQSMKTFKTIGVILLIKKIWNNLSGSSTGNSGWPCPSCTLVNPPTTKVCSACNTNRDGKSVRQNSPSSSGPAANPARTMQRQRSVPVESRRKRDEKQAKEQWIDIVKYCKIVSM